MQMISSASDSLAKRSSSESNDTKGLFNQAFIDSLRKLPTATSLAQLKAHLCMREHLSQEECNQAQIPTLEHASLLHSHIQPSESELPHVTNDQTQNAIIYITLVIIIYVVIVVWFIAANFPGPRRSQLTFTCARHRLGQIINGSRVYDGDSDDNIDFSNDLNETEALLVVRDNGDRGQARSSTCLIPEEDDGEQV